MILQSVQALRAHQRVQCVPEVPVEEKYSSQTQVRVEGVRTRSSLIRDLQCELTEGPGGPGGPLAPIIPYRGEKGYLVTIVNNTVNIS